MSKKAFGIAALLALNLLTGAGAAYSYSGDRVVQTDYGYVRGGYSDDRSAIRWLGIPFASPPVGDLRWQAPKPPERWPYVRDAKVFGEPCVQTGSIYGPPQPGKEWGKDNVETFGKIVGSEDCLTLNIWRPNTREVDLPVFVFIHGGSGIAGSAIDPIYEGTKLSTMANALVVTIQYRLGIFGSLAHPALEASDSLSRSGNFAILDVLQALKFIQENIERFGGSAYNVTLAGQSAGAILVYSVMGSPLSEGLFQKAVAFSGLIGESTPLEDGYTAAEALFAEMGKNRPGTHSSNETDAAIAGSDSRAQLKYMRSIPAGELLMFQKEHPTLPEIKGTFGDGVVLPADLKQSYKDGDFRQVNTIIGSTKDEARLNAGVFRVDNAKRFAWMIDTDPDAEPQVPLHDLVKWYLLPIFGSCLYEGYTSVLSSLLHKLVQGSIDIVAQHAPATYVYQFDWNRGPEPWKTLYGAGHAIDLPFWFGNFDGNFFSMSFSEQNRHGREQLSGVMIKALSSFLHTGDPGLVSPDLEWSKWSTQEGQAERLHLDATDTDLNLSLK